MKKHWQFFVVVLVTVTTFLAKNKIIAQTKPLDLQKPDDVIIAYRKIFCSRIDGEEVIFWWQGKVYSRVSGEKDRHLFNIQGMNICTCGTVTNEKGMQGYRLVSREVMLYLDPKTNQILRTWSNPFLDKEVKVFHVANDPVNDKPRFADQVKFSGSALSQKQWSMGDWGTRLRPLGRTGAAAHSAIPQTIERSRCSFARLCLCL